MQARLLALFFFFNDTATTEIYTLSLHDALPISQSDRRGEDPVAHHPRCRAPGGRPARRQARPVRRQSETGDREGSGDRKSTRLNSSHLVISYAVFCLKKKSNRVAAGFRRRLRLA